MPEFSTVISSVPPCSADTFAWSLPSAPPGKRFTLILPPDLAATSSANFSMPVDERMALGVLERELDASCVLRRRRPNAASASAASSA